MRKVLSKKITQVVQGLCIKANTDLRPDVLSALKCALRSETSVRAKNILNTIIENAYIAHNEKIAICQDTGLPFVLVELGQGLKIEGDLNKAINKGIELGYKKASLRASIVPDPLKRGRPGYAPAVIHSAIVRGDKLKLTVLPKGFGCENKSRLKCFEPTADIKEIKKFIIDVVRDAGPDACPPYIVGVGIGGTADYAMFLAKKSLLKKIMSHEPSATSYIYKLEHDLLKEINKLNIGPMGLGGKTTCLGVNILTYPTHIAGLPVAVNISCHALRSASKII